MTVLYSAGCPKCKVLKGKLSAAGIQYIEVSSVEKMIEMGFDSVPILEVDGERMDFAAAVSWINNRSSKNEHTD